MTARRATRRSVLALVVLVLPVVAACGSAAPR